MAKRPILRVPSGVPAPIRRALHLTRGGSFLSYAKAAQLMAALHGYEEDLQRDYDKAARAMERARTQPTHDKWGKELRAVQRQDAERRAALAALQKGAGQEPLPPLPSKAVEPLDVLDESDVSAAEWEIGVDYTEAAGWDHEKGSTSDVSFNARIFRTNRQPIHESELRDVMEVFAETGHLRGGFEAKAVRWQTASGYKRRGTADDLESFRAILLTVAQELRVGAVKPERGT
jgi:hypothetical protein